MRNTLKNFKSSKAVKALSLFLTSVLVFSPTGLIAGTLPTGHRVVSGAVSVRTNGNTMNITQGSRKAIVNWQSFSIGEENIVNVIQPSSLGKAAMLARVVGTDPSDILGQLKIDQTMYLVNPNGVYFGANSRVDAGAMFAASTLEISDADFLAGNDIFSGGSEEAVINQGQINAQAAALIANKVGNTGAIKGTKQATLLGTREVELTNFGADAKLTLRFGEEKANTTVINTGDVFAGGDAILFSDGGWTDNSKAESPQKMRKSVVNTLICSISAQSIPRRCSSTQWVR
ncbi:MAG: filamentous hemagglutinin N-terminal domain-containing protein [Victivallales bacterium]|nr:filamentous hemagglutinin N-terminal domain-containing protein [Victivallales bacterium]